MGKTSHVADLREPPVRPDRSAPRSSVKRVVQRGRRFLLGTALFSLAVVTSVACDGDNMFSGESPTSRPNVNITAPSLIIAGDSFQVRVDARAPRGLARIDLSITGAFFEDRTMEISSGGSASPIFRFRAPTFLAETFVIVQASVVDQIGTKSAIAADTVVAFMPEN